MKAKLIEAIIILILVIVLAIASTIIMRGVIQ
jgi:hypothetical protein